MLQMLLLQYGAKLILHRFYIEQVVVFTNSVYHKAITAREEDADDLPRRR